MQTVSRLLATLALLSALSGSAHARPGDLDPSFGESGSVSIAVAQGQAKDALAMPDGSILIAGSGDLEGDGREKLLLMRIDADGRLASDFGAAGLVSTPVNGTESASLSRLTLDPDGRIVAAGIIADTGIDRLSVLARYFPDGEPDFDFGSGVIPLRSAGRAREMAGVAVAPDRRILFVGTDDALIFGSLGFGSASAREELPESSSGSDLVPHAGGFIVGGTVERAFFLTRLDETGAVDTQFGDAGRVRTPIAQGISALRRVLVLPDGRIVAIGVTRVNNPVRIEIALVRYTAEGALDPTFGTDGIVLVARDSRRDDALDAALGPDGTILVGGRTCAGGAATCRGLLARLLPDGSLDPAFGEGGVVTTDGIIDAVALPDDGHVVTVERATDAIVVARFTLAECGNGRLEAGEECDDGNLAAGDCCSPTCTLDPDDSPCDDDGSACTADVCRAGACTHAVPDDAGCFAPTSSALARPAANRLRWSWQTTSPVDASTFGDPTDATGVSVCVLDGSALPLVELHVPAAGTCGAAPCWKATPKGFRYKDATASADGVASLRLVAGADGGRIILKARNVPGADGFQAPLRVRLVRHDARECFEADLASTQGTSLRLR
jgi:uncharacterized delta-60 repeat protein